MTGLFKFDFYIRDWVTGTRGLSAAARGAYIDLLSAMYDTGGPIPHDRKYLCRYLGFRDRRQLDPLIAELIEAEKIFVDGDRLSNARAMIEIDAFNERQNQASKGGKSKPQKSRERLKNGTRSDSRGDLEAPRVRTQGAGIGEKQTLNPCPSPSPSPSPSPIEEERDAPTPESASNIVPISAVENASTDTGRKYAFNGQAVKLTETDLTTWRENYHGIPDIGAELISIDGWFVGKGMVGAERPKGWFQMTSNMLNKAHQKYLAEQQKPKKPVSEMSYFERIEAGVI